jgi:hypothetical protein
MRASHRLIHQHFHCPPSTPPVIAFNARYDRLK